MPAHCSSWLFQGPRRRLTVRDKSEPQQSCMLTQQQCWPLDLCTGWRGHARAILLAKLQGSSSIPFVTLSLIRKGDTDPLRTQASGTGLVCLQRGHKVLGKLSNSTRGQASQCLDSAKVRGCVTIRTLRPDPNLKFTVRPLPMRRSHNAPKEPKDYESWGLLYSWVMLVTQAGGTIYI